MEAYPELSFRWEWESGSGVRAAELRATWARLEIWVGLDCVTLVEDRESQSSRRSIYCPLYPVAEWIAFNWWFLRADARPAPELSRARTGLGASRSYERSHLGRHNLRSAGDGYVWPYLLIVPEGESTRLVWQRDDSAVPGHPVRFLGQGEATLDKQGVELALASFVDAVLTRLAEQGVTDTALEKEWSEVTEIDKDEEEFCLAAARLGLDPFSEAADVQAEILRAAEELSGHAFEDFLDAVSPRRVGPGLDWISAARRRIRRSASQRSTMVSELRRTASRLAGVRGVRPWEMGWRQASEVRGLLHAPSEGAFSIDDLLASRVQENEDRGLQAVGGTVSGAAPVIVLGRPQPRTAKRFTLARALWHVLYEDDPLFLVTAAYTDRQKVERAFAAELLAPAKGIADLLGGSPDVVTSEDIEQLAEHFRVSPRVVEHQLENQLAASIVG